MKKNRMMRLASLLLICVLLTTSVISGTFAKYTGETSATASARVAKWGWDETEMTLDLFKNAYDETGAATVQGKDGALVIAPGTSNSVKLVWAAVSTFNPEVDYTLTFTAEGTIPAEIEAELDWTLTNDGTTTTYATFGALVEALGNVKYNGKANTAAPTLEFEIGWVWEYANGGDDADNALGNAASLAELAITVTMTATQVD